MQLAEPNLVTADDPAPALIDQSLAEQLRITEPEIRDRKSLLDFTEADVDSLRECKPIVSEHLDSIVDEFYDKQRRHPDIVLLIGDAETFSRLHGSMRRYVMELFDGFYDAEYVNSRLRIGKVHKRIGVPPKLYISALHLLETILLRHVMDDGPRGEARRTALHKLLMFDIQLVFDTYIASLVSQVESARDQLQTYATSLEHMIAERTRQLEELSRKDPLTGLANQRAFFTDLRRELAIAQRTHQPVSLVYFDLNGFKGLNDTQGHLAGDDMLIAVGRALGEVLRETDTACRYGGDEFCLILPATDSIHAEQTCQRVIAAFDKIASHGVTFSIGIAEAGTGPTLSADDLVRAADTAMYIAKARSRCEPGHYISVAADVP